MEAKLTLGANGQISWNSAELIVEKFSNFREFIMNFQKVISFWNLAERKMVQKWKKK